TPVRAWRRTKQKRCRERHQRSTNAQSIQSLGRLHDRNNEGAGMNTVTPQDLTDFVYSEARMLDERRFETWLDLFAEDGYYWMPLRHDQTDPLLEGSLMYEDKLLLRVRVERLTGQRTYSQQPKSRSHHLLQQPTIEAAHSWHDPEKGHYAVR